eukprot:CAMPEP_0205880724 /NCGR_PEP_ID=MMETSP1083-20121108/16083_1 /ASSEMBLY_ACC=CAM_ASM_000430 /TAXON_ID=97485 /ORGANISM="Prymnesium parvum, Strain Texoma1" /LENGTH=93 /DNA_ID=CAMNT_0053243769 /DNA_START=725 /DNA_END=1003 /DNA_ORIENTATION=-
MLARLQQVGILRVEDTREAAAEAAAAHVVEAAARRAGLPGVDPPLVPLPLAHRVVVKLSTGSTGSTGIWKWKRMPSLIPRGMTTSMIPSGVLT